MKISKPDLIDKLRKELIKVLPKDENVNNNNNNNTIIPTSNTNNTQCKYPKTLIDDDNFLILFLRVKDYNVEKATDLLHKFFIHKSNIFSPHQSTSPTDYKKLFDQQVGVVLKKRDEYGRKICLIRIEQWKGPWSFDDLLMHAYLYFLETMLISPKTQENGIVFLIDLKGLHFEHVKSVGGLWRLKKICCFIQGSLPVRIKAVHMVNNSFIFGLIYSVMKGFLSSKILKRHHLHGSSLSSLHNHINPEILPEIYGGTGGSVDECIDRDVLEGLMGREYDYYGNVR